jgi:hypothetical protein
MAQPALLAAPPRLGPELTPHERLLASKSFTPEQNAAVTAWLESGVEEVPSWLASLLLDPSQLPESSR